MEAKRMSPLKAIKAHCLDCCGGSRQEVKACEIADCPLHPFRLGKNPHRKGIGQKNPTKMRVFGEKAAG